MSADALALAEAALARIQLPARKVTLIADRRERDLKVVDDLALEASELAGRTREIVDIAERYDALGEAMDMLDRARELLRPWR